MSDKTHELAVDSIKPWGGPDDCLCDDVNRDMAQGGCLCFVLNANSAYEVVSELRAQRDRLAAALRHLRHVADERGASSDLWNAIAHEERAKADGVWSPDVWAALREVEHGS